MKDAIRLARTLCAEAKEAEGKERRDLIDAAIGELEIALKRAPVPELVQAPELASDPEYVRVLADAVAEGRLSGAEALTRCRSGLERALLAALRHQAKDEEARQ